MITTPFPYLLSASNVNIPTGGGAAVVVLGTGGGPSVSNVICNIIASYTVVPTGGNLKVVDGNSNTLLNVDITQAGKQEIDFQVPVRAAPGQAVTITLAAGTNAKLNVISSQF